MTPRDSFVKNVRGQIKDITLNYYDIQFHIQNDEKSMT